MINYIIGGLILLTLVFAIRKLIKDHKNYGTCAGCSGCPSASHCSRANNL